MNIYLLTSNEYSFLLKPFSVLMNRFWKNQNVVCLCYDVPDLDLPDNFKMVSIGKQGYWSNALIDYFESIDDTHFVINLEDMVLVDYVDDEKVKLLENEIINKRADKAVLHFYSNEDTVIDKGNDIVELKQNEDYRTSIHPAIWTKEYWLKHLKRDQSLWAFETVKEAHNDGAKIIFHKENIHPTPIFNAMNIYRKGLLLKDHLDAVNKLVEEV